MPEEERTIKERLEYLRGELRAERISYGELVELQGLAEHIEPGDVELLEWAGVPEEKIDNPLDPEFWWSNHERMVREGKMDKPFRRNPSDIKDALSLMPEAREPIRDALKAAQRFHNIRAYQAADETAIYTAIARLMDAGVLVRGRKDQ